MRSRCKAVLSQTLLRAQEHLRGALNDEFPRPPPGGRRRHGAAGTLLQFLNGDIREPRAVHFEQGCCQADGCFSRERAIENVFAAAVSAGLFGGMENTLPSKSRWAQLLPGRGVHTAQVCFFRGYRLP